ncbi:hypothetical protein [Nannocystis exedens]|uniref:hypothetical protein n=1 Tax=Nannocystis exedens TaxID=54 RepID=UPI001160DDDD|nr:hypothetical protein [Nannocystis exedens]
MAVAISIARASITSRARTKSSRTTTAGASLVGDGAVHCARVEDRPELPRQRGALYALSAEGGASLKAQRAVWLSQGLVEPGGAFDTWPGDPAAEAACGCGKTCGCAPCRLTYGHQHDHEEKSS